MSLFVGGVLFLAFFFFWEGDGFVNTRSCSFLVPSYSGVDAAPEEVKTDLSPFDLFGVVLGRRFGRGKGLGWIGIFFVCLSVWVEG